jgi:hypothetical protein
MVGIVMPGHTAILVLDIPEPGRKIFERRRGA